MLKAVWKFLKDSLEALAQDDREHIRSSQVERDKEKRWREYLSPPR